MRKRSRQWRLNLSVAALVFVSPWAIVACSGERLSSANKLVLPALPPTQIKPEWGLKPSDNFTHSSIPILNTITLQDLIIWWASLNHNFNIDQSLLNLAQNHQNAAQMPLANKVFQLKNRVNQALFGVADFVSISGSATLKDYIFNPVSPNPPPNLSDNILRIFAPNSPIFNDEQIIADPLVQLYNDPFANVQGATLRDYLIDFENKTNPNIAINNLVGIRLRITLQEPNQFMVNDRAIGPQLDLMFKIPVQQQQFVWSDDLVTKVVPNLLPTTQISFSDAVATINHQTKGDQVASVTAQFSDLIDKINEAVAAQDNKQLNKLFLQILQAVFGFSQSDFLAANFQSNWNQYFQIVASWDEPEFQQNSNKVIKNVNLFNPTTNTQVKQYLNQQANQDEPFTLELFFQAQVVPAGQPNNGWALNFKTEPEPGQVEELKYYRPPVFQIGERFVNAIHLHWRGQPK